ncbi:MAG: DUF86 domain-containing protein [Candidatus Sericytochromatia bacterium]|uniref:DUF86 domain-containing protein n=1 Tax=Candidatus Tanganyikabacteria bacterium TaxID=2961651 RepID=A0A937X4B6_9BACT|nr:DUF86 domain-containing protein [Candidatus Tanganyikabacteria bacterium]
MASDVLLNKAAIIERCLARIAEEYQVHESELETNLTRQDAIVLNVQRACEAAIDAAMHLVKDHRLGLPQESREAFSMLESAGLLDAALAGKLQAMVGFRNIAIHDYTKLSLAILRAILDRNLADLAAFARLLVRQGA